MECGVSKVSTRERHIIVEYSLNRQRYAAASAYSSRESFRRLPRTQFCAHSSLKTRNCFHTSAYYNSAKEKRKSFQLARRVPVEAVLLSAAVAHKIQSPVAVLDDNASDCAAALLQRQALLLAARVKSHATQRTGFKLAISALLHHCPYQSKGSPTRVG